MTNFVFVATSLDGYIADEDGGIDWLTATPNPEGSDYGYAAFISKIDALVMGRGTFEKVLSFPEWPYQRPVLVLSQTLVRLPDSVTGKAELASSDPVAIVEQLRHRGLRNLYIDGGKTVQSFLQRDLIDEMIITRIPILLGGGVPLFGSLDRPLDFSLKKSTRLNPWLVQDHYLRSRSE